MQRMVCVMLKTWISCELTVNSLLVKIQWAIKECISRECAAVLSRTDRTEFLTDCWWADVSYDALLFLKSFNCRCLKPKQSYLSSQGLMGIFSWQAANKVSACKDVLFHTCAKCNPVFLFDFALYCTICWCIFVLYSFLNIVLTAWLKCGCIKEVSREFLWLINAHFKERTCVCVVMERATLPLFEC